MTRRDSELLLKTFKNILLIQLGDIGDLVWMTPTISAVKKSYPEAKVSLLVRADFGQLLHDDPSVHRVLEVRRSRNGLLNSLLGHFRFIKELRDQQFDLVIDFRADDRGAFMAYITGSRYRVSQPYQNVPFWRKYLFTHLVVPAPPPARLRGAAESSLRLVGELGVTTEQRLPVLWVSEETITRVQNLMKKERIEVSEKWITVNPCSRWSYKEWALEKWAEVINWLGVDFGLATVIVGTWEERDKTEALRCVCGGRRIFNLAGKTTLGELAGVLAQSFLHLGVDSAAPHIAAAVGTPTITLYGPSDWIDWAPIGEKHRVIIPELDCVPCHKKGCEGKGWSRCLDELTVDKVKEEIRETLINLKQFEIGKEKP